ncbi:MAG: response regulator [Bacteroidota bacterium]
MKTEILIIDDDEISIMLTKILLDDHPYFGHIKTFSDGTYALEYLRSDYSIDTNYHIILDINMPLMNGWEFLEEVKKFASANNTFVYMLSSSTDTVDIEKSKQFDLVKDFFCKPLKEEHLNKIQ